MAGSKVFSPWWLVVIPACLGVGALIAKLPAPPQKPRRVDVVELAPRAVKAAEQRLAARSGSANDMPRSEAPPPATEAAAQPEPAPAPEKPKGWFAPQTSEWTTMESALAESKSSGKPILIDFNADWCGPCQGMKREVFENYDRGNAVKVAVIPVSIVDRARENGQNPPEIEELQQRYSVDAFPTLIVFSPQTGRSVRTQGFGDADRTLEWIQGAAEAVR